MYEDDSYQQLETPLQCRWQGTGDRGRGFL